MAILPAMLAAATAAYTGPIIDMHLHALHAGDQGPPPVWVCAPYRTIPRRDAGQDSRAYFGATFKTKPDCPHPLVSAADDDALRRESLAELKRLNITAVTSGEPDVVERWRRDDPTRVLPAIALLPSDKVTVERLRALHKAGRLTVIGEIGAQYEGVAPNDPQLEPIYALAEELDVPVAIHIGPGPPGTAYVAGPRYRMAHSDPLLLEDVLVRHPRLRLQVMHAAWPLTERMIALMYAHPQVYVDVAVIDWTQPRAEFHRHLKELVDAGYGDRIMFGSDQMVWPGAIAASVEAINAAPFLSLAQKRAILHDNAARFLRLNAAPAR